MAKKNKELVWLKLDAMKIEKLQALALSRKRTLNGYILELIDQAIQERKIINKGNNIINNSGHDSRFKIQ